MKQMSLSLCVFFGVYPARLCVPGTSHEYLRELCGIILTFHSTPECVQRAFAVVGVFDLFQWHRDVPVRRNFTGIDIRKYMQARRPLLCVMYLSLVFLPALMYCGISDCFSFLCCRSVWTREPCTL